MSETSDQKGGEKGGATTISCPKCRNKNPAGAQFCGFCGANMATSPALEKATLFGYVADGMLITDKGSSAMEPTRPPAAADPTADIPSNPSQRDTAPTPKKSASPPQQSASETRLAGRYELGDPLATLPTGVLYTAGDTSTGIAVEVLLVETAVFSSPIEQERARRELRQLQKIDSPSVQRVLDHGQAANGQIFVVFEALAGNALPTLLSQGPFDLSTARGVTIDVANALVAAQKLGIIHRDLGAHNVTLIADGVAKLRMSGLASPLASKVFGACDFVSPEQAAGRPVDQRSNIYSLGAMLFHMVTGHPPFGGDNEAILRQHQEDPPPTLAQRRAELAGLEAAEQLVAKALAKMPSRRHLTLRQFLREIEALQTAKTDEAPDDGTSPYRVVTLETPVHGVAALGGQAPSAIAHDPAAIDPAMARTIVPATPAVMPAAVVLPPGTSSPEQVDDRAATIIAGGQPATPSAQVASSPVASTPQPDLDIPTADTFVAEPMVASTPSSPSASQEPNAALANAAPGVAVSGEMDRGTRVRMEQTESEPLPARGEGAKERPSGKGFRETMWFFKGEVESALAEKGDEQAAVPASEDPAQLATKYADDGSLSDDEARRLSLRTGKTVMMQRQHLSGHLSGPGAVPGAKMNMHDMIDEFSTGRRTAMIVGGALLAVGAVLALWLWLGR